VSIEAAIKTAQAIVEQDRGQADTANPNAEPPFVLNGTVYTLTRCGGCGRPGWLLTDNVAAWCAGCGGRELINPESLIGEGPFDNGLAKLIGHSSVVHLVAPPVGAALLCMPNVRVGRMRPAPEAADPTCKRCISARDARDGDRG
jgi:hypothetical protein